MARKRDDGYPKSTPLWVIDEITRLKRDVEYWKDKLRSVETGESEVGYDWYGHANEKRQFLPTKTPVWFLLPGQKDPIQARVTRAGLKLYGGMGYLVVVPNAINTITIRQEVLR